MTNSIITPDLVDLGLEAPSRQAATRQLAERLAARGRVTDLDGFLADVAAREQQMPTGSRAGSASRTPARPSSPSRPWRSRAARRA
jgi:mannitol/fructose-specific phosphotransferase system IIA component (Ntr-type)